MKYYRVKKDTPLWLEGAILKKNDSGSGYVSISNLWDVMANTTEYLSSRFIESQPEYTDDGMQDSAFEFASDHFYKGMIVELFN